MGRELAKASRLGRLVFQAISNRDLVVVKDVVLLLAVRLS